MRIPSIKTAIEVMAKIKNWRTYFSCYLNPAKRGGVVYEMRDGSRYKVRPGAGEAVVLMEVVLHRCYNPPGFDIGEDDVVLDVGAHIGVFSVFAAKSLRLGRVYAFEPMEGNFEMLRQNIELNNAVNVVAVNKAVSSESGFREIFSNASEKATTGHSLCRHIHDQDVHIKKTVVESVSLEDFVRENNIRRIDFMKMDCEGAEYEILSNCPAGVMAIIEKISMEYHNVDENLNGTCMKKILEDRGFQVTLGVHGRMNPDKAGMLYAKRKK